jgi:hypothetical protein
MRKNIKNLRQIGGIEERKSCLSLILSQCFDSNLLSYRDEEANVDIFIIEFNSQEEASQANLLMGLTNLPGTNLASLIIPTGYLH